MHIIIWAHIMQQQFEAGSERGFGAAAAASAAGGKSQPLLLLLLLVNDCGGAWRKTKN
jgi:hypothetical protein